MGAETKCRLATNNIVTNVVLSLLTAKYMFLKLQLHHFISGSVYFTTNILVATDQLELLCCQSKIRLVA